jgi:adenylate cyclase class IV
MVRIAPRDIAVLTDLLESRVMTSTQIARLHFDGRAETSKKRLQALKKAGLISERQRNILEPAVRFLSKKGFLRLRRFLGNGGREIEYHGKHHQSISCENAAQV